MQNDKQCFQCKFPFNCTQNLPKQLTCQHVLCFHCVLKSYYQVNQVICPWCKQITVKNPFDLETPFKHADICIKHDQQKKLLFCRDDFTPICQVCSFSEEHKGHKIEVAAEIIEKLKQEEVSKAQQAKAIIENTLKEYKQILETKQKESQAQFQQMQSEIVQNSQQLLDFIFQNQQNQLSSLQVRQQVISQRYQSTILNADEMIDKLEGIIIKDQQNICDLASFVCNLQELIKENINIDVLEVNLVWKNTIQQVSKEINSLNQYQIQEKSDLNLVQKLNQKIIEGKQLLQVKEQLAQQALLQNQKDLVAQLQKLNNPLEKAKEQEQKDIEDPNLQIKCQKGHQMYKTQMQFHYKIAHRLAANRL